LDYLIPTHIAIRHRVFVYVHYGSERCRC
jgi:hypothetical protein